jgi:hypothetical protein
MKPLAVLILLVVLSRSHGEGHLCATIGSACAVAQFDQPVEELTL